MTLTPEELRRLAKLPLASYDLKSYELVSENVKAVREALESIATALEDGSLHEDRDSTGNPRR